MKRVIAAVVPAAALVLQMAAPASASPTHSCETYTVPTCSIIAPAAGQVAWTCTVQPGGVCNVSRNLRPVGLCTFACSGSFQVNAGDEIIIVAAVGKGTLHWA